MSSYEETEAKMKAEHDAILSKYEMERDPSVRALALIIGSCLWFGLWAVFIVVGAIIK